MCIWWTHGTQVSSVQLSTWPYSNNLSGYIFQYLKLSMISPFPNYYIIIFQVVLVWLYWKCCCCYKASGTVLLWPVGKDKACFLLFVLDKKSRNEVLQKNYIKLICCNQKLLTKTSQLIISIIFPCRKWWMSVAQQIKINMQRQMSRAEKKLYLAWIGHSRLLPDQLKKAIPVPKPRMCIMTTRYSCKLYLKCF